jgi:hypothetical protein
MMKEEPGNDSQGGIDEKIYAHMCCRIALSIVHQRLMLSG